MSATVSQQIKHRKGINMIFDILTHNSLGEKVEETIFVETQMYDAWEMLNLLRAANFQDVLICCASEYENGLIFN